MNMVSFDSKLLPEGNLYCPKEFTKKKNVHFKVIVVFDESDFLSREVISIWSDYETYYSKLKIYCFQQFVDSKCRVYKR